MGCGYGWGLRFLHYYGNGAKARRQIIHQLNFLYLNSLKKLNGYGSLFFERCLCMVREVCVWCVSNAFRVLSVCDLRVQCPPCPLEWWWENTPLSPPIPIQFTLTFDLSFRGYLYGPVVFDLPVEGEGQKAGQSRWRATTVYAGFRSRPALIQTHLIQIITMV